MFVNHILVQVLSAYLIKLKYLKFALIYTYCIPWITHNQEVRTKKGGLTHMSIHLCLAMTSGEVGLV